jgi:hypothetical protein
MIEATTSDQRGRDLLASVGFRIRKSRHNSSHPWSVLFLVQNLVEMIVSWIHLCARPQAVAPNRIVAATDAAVILSLRSSAGVLRRAAALQGIFGVWAIKAGQ